VSPLAGAQPIRVLVVDDSTTYRRLVTTVLRTDQAVTVMGEAANGVEALDVISRSRPDIVLLDVEMPVMDGLVTMRNIHSRWPELPVLMFSSLTSDGAAVTLEALAAGATDYVVKPTGAGGAAQSRAVLHAEVIAKMKAICRPTPAPAVQPAASAMTARPPRPPRTGPVKIVAIGSSTGGPNALAAVVGALPAGLGVPVVIVQHMPAAFTSLLAERLGRGADLAVSEAAEPAVLEPGHVYVAHGGRHLVVERRNGARWAVQNDAPPENSCRPAVDVLFRSVAESYGPEVLGVVLTGMGSDGQLGSDAIVRAGGSVFAQDEKTSVVWGMPGAVARAGLADRILPLAEIGRAIAERVGGTSISRQVRLTATGGGRP